MSKRQREYSSYIGAGYSIYPRLTGSYGGQGNQTSSSVYSIPNTINRIDGSTSYTQMAYRRKYKKIKKFARKYKKKLKSKFIMRVKPEIKNVQWARNTQFVKVTGGAATQGVAKGMYIDAFSGITQAVGGQSRIGNKVQLLGIKVSALISHVDHVTDDINVYNARGPGMWKLNISKMREQGVDVTTLADSYLYDYPTGGMSLALPALQDYKINSGVHKPARVLHSVKKLLDGFAGENEAIEFYWKPKKPMTVIWSNTGSSFTDIQKNAIFVELQFGQNVGNLGTDNTTFPYLDLYVTTYFVDA